MDISQDCPRSGEILLYEVKVGVVLEVEVKSKNKWVADSLEKPFFSHHALRQLQLDHFALAENLHRVELFTRVVFDEYDRPEGASPIQGHKTCEVIIRGNVTWVFKPFLLKGFPCCCHSYWILYMQMPFMF